MAARAGSTVPTAITVLGVMVDVLGTSGVRRVAVDIQQSSSEGDSNYRRNDQGLKWSCR